MSRNSRIERYKRSERDKPELPKAMGLCDKFYPATEFGGMAKRWGWSYPYTEKEWVGAYGIKEVAALKASYDNEPNAGRLRPAASEETKEG